MYIIFLFYFTAAGVKCLVAVVKHQVIHHNTDYIFISFGIIEPILLRKKSKLLKPTQGVGGVFRLDNDIAAYEET